MQSIQLRKTINVPLLRSRVVTIPYPKVTVQLRNPNLQIAKSSWTELGRVLEYDTYIIGKGIMLFTMFYCSLNWLHYRKINKELEEMDKKDKK